MRDFLENVGYELKKLDVIVDYLIKTDADEGRYGKDLHFFGVLDPNIQIEEFPYLHIQFYGSVENKWARVMVNLKSDEDSNSRGIILQVQHLCKDPLELATKIYNSIKELRDKNNINEIP